MKIGNGRKKTRIETTERAKAGKNINVPESVFKEVITKT
jgi:hypothetical protein